MIVLVKLLLAHFICDFLLQPASWINAKEERKVKAYQLYLHMLLHGMVTLVFVWDWSFLSVAVFIAFSHGVIDVVKLYLQKDQTRRLYFFLDQGVHVMSLYFIYCWYQGTIPFSGLLTSESNFVLMSMIIFLTIPCSVIVKVFISKWTPATEGDGFESLDDAGKVIGIFERLFVFAFVIGGLWEAIGFLLAAKSVFRFGDLKESKDRKLTEYILIGTLTSFGIAILAGMAYMKWLME